MISSYYSAEDLPEVDLSKTGSHTFTVQHGDDTKFGQFTVEVMRLLRIPVAVHRSSQPAVATEHRVMNAHGLQSVLIATGH